MSRVRLLHGVRRQHPDGVRGQLVKGRGYGWKNARFWRAFDALQPDPLYQDFICVEAGGLALDLPNGRHPRITYETNGAAFIALRIQELYGITQTPRIALGRVPLAVHILAPSMRPVQITQDLASFWREHYPKIKQELQRKYPKHEWR